ncbi:MAG: DHH family phosphoesterase, partial [Rhizobium sp.]|nr:DHH family phosphoesterase [Rhizobium sp.]
MKALRTLIPAFLASHAAAIAQKQTVLGASGRTKQLGVGHFSEWSRATKKAFLIDWQAGNASEWTIVAGNEGGDLDSMTSALTWAYHLEHSTENTSHPIKAIALLQTPSHALDLRPENQLALDNSQMTPGHEDLLTMDELPEDPETLSRKMKGIVLVDHGEPLRKWSHAKILSIFDHHKDRGNAPDAEPRIFEVAASCTTLVARQMLDELEKLDQEYHMPHELLELILSAIAIDSGGLTSDKTTKEDIKTSKRILARSAWAKRDLEDVMEDLDDQLSKAQKKIDGLDLRDLLRRDWKGDLIDTPSPRTPSVSLGFASVPYSMDEQILKTDFAELFDWFAVHAVRIIFFLRINTTIFNPFHPSLPLYVSILTPHPGLDRRIRCRHLHHAQQVQKALQRRLEREAPRNRPHRARRRARRPRPGRRAVQGRQRRAREQRGGN